MSSENGTVTLALLGRDHPKATLHVNLVVALGKATVVDRETAMMIEAAIHEVMMTEPPPDSQPFDFAMKFTRRLIFTCENLLEGYEAGANIAMKNVQRGDADTITHVSSQTFAEERGYCRGFVDTMRTSLRCRLLLYLRTALVPIKLNVQRSNQQPLNENANPRRDTTNEASFYFHMESTGLRRHTP